MRRLGFIAAWAGLSSLQPLQKRSKRNSAWSVATRLDRDAYNKAMLEESRQLSLPQDRQGAGDHGATVLLGRAVEVIELKQFL